MLQNILKSAWRQLWKNKTHSGISLLGLALGFTVAILSLLWVNHQLGYDTFHERADRIYRGMQNYQPSAGPMETYPDLPMPMAEVLRNETSGVKRVALTDWGFDQTLVRDEVRIRKFGNYVEANFLNIFTFPALHGDLKSALLEPNQIVLTAATAEALFGETDVIGKTVNLGRQTSLQVSAVLENVPVQSTLQFDFLLPYSLKMQLESWMTKERQNWGSYSYQIYFELEEGVSVESLLAQHEHTLEEHKGGGGTTFSAHELSDWHLYSEFDNGQAVKGRMRNVQLFGIVGLLVLLIACINFINLATARTEKRYKEVAVRKTIGATTSRLAAQFLGESGVLIGLAFLVSLIAVAATLPAFGQLVETPLHLPLNSLGFWGASLALILFCVIIAGGYPAFFLTRYSAREIMQRGKATVSTGQIWGRRVLVVTQFVLSIALIAGSLAVYKQVQYGQSLDIGYDKTRLINVPYTADLSKNYSTLKQQLLSKGVAESVTCTSSDVTEVSSSTSTIQWPGKVEGEQVDMGFIGIGEDYFATLGLEILDGRTFRSEPDTDMDAIIINEAARQRMGLEDPIGTVLQWGDNSHPIVGVVENAIMESPFDPIRSVLFLKRNWRGPMVIRLTADQPLTTSLGQLEELVAQHDPITPFSYSFIEDAYADKFATTNFLGAVMLAFAALAVLLSALGLLGLAMYLVERKSKEVSIRKILGATVQQIWLLLSSEFMLLIMVGGLVAIPLGAYFLNQWLDTFTYRIDFPWMVFALAIGLALTIALLTVSAQSLKAAMVNPAERLRDE
ncbi:MAG: ABC transporter permease [Bacteroidota bacterium]